MSSTQKRVIIICLCLFIGYFLIYNNFNFAWRKLVLYMNKHEKEPDTHFKLILNAYKHSGSTATGRILSKRSDTFYVHEPLWQVALSEFYKGPCLYCKDLGLDLEPSACVFDRNACANMTSGGDSTVSENWNKNHKTLAESSEFLQSLLDCSFHRFGKFFFDPENPVSEKDNIKTIFYHGQGWDEFKVCRDQKKLPFNYCLIAGRKHCISAKHRVIKLLRMTLDRLEPLLKTDPSLKVIHLFRDPRGIFNSQIGAGLYPVDDKTLIKARVAIRGLCERLLIDIRASYMFKVLYPDRFKVIQYETFFDKPVENSAKELYEFAEMEYGIEQQNVIQTKFNKKKTNKTTGFHPFSYRTKLPWSVVQLFNEECTEVIDRLGYTQYTDEVHLKDLSQSGFTGNELR